MARNGGSFDAQVGYAALDERVTNLRGSLINLEGEMRSGFNQLNTTIVSLSNELRSSQKTQWPVIWAAAGVVFTMLMGLGGAMFWPVSSRLAEQKEELAVMRDSVVPREELNWRGDRSKEDRERVQSALNDVRAAMVARSEWMERNRARDNEIANIHEAHKTTAQDLQRQLDEIKQAQAGVYSARDVIFDLRNRLDRLEAEKTRNSLIR